MTTQIDGGPAYPTGTWEYDGNGNVLPYQEPGMSLRDYFAAQAMSAIFCGDGARMVADRDERYDETNWAEVVAANAYEMADAMIAERAKRVDRAPDPLGEALNSGDGSYRP